MASPSSTAGARWLASELHDLGAVVVRQHMAAASRSTDEQPAPTRWPMTDHMQPDSLKRWAEICLDLGARCD